MTHNTDYHSIELDPQKDPTDYHYTERRAKLLIAIEQNGDPYTINQTSWAAHFDVDQSTISRDVDVLADYLGGIIGEKAETVAWTSFKAALDECSTAREKFDLAMEWQEWLQSTGRQETAAMQIEQTHIDGDSSGSYEILTDDETIDADGETVNVAAIRTGSAAGESDTGESDTDDDENSE